MFIAKEERQGYIYYSLCESVIEDGRLKNKKLFDLGTDPSAFIHYPGGNSFYIDESIEMSLLEKGYKVDTFVLERLFWPFVDPRLKRVLRDPAGTDRHRKRPTRDEVLQAQRQIHIFDRRRLHFLRFGVINQGDLEEVPHRYFLKISNMSRDEIECYISDREQGLRRAQVKTYVYTIFDLKRYFPGQREALLAPWMLNEDVLDRAFHEELCKLNRDESFWGGPGYGNNLHDYLKRYVIMFYDYQFPKIRVVSGEHWWHSRQQPLQRLSRPSISESLRVMGLTEEEFSRMDRKALQRLYRAKAKKCHPDRGGRKEEFIALKRAYERLRELKR